MPIGHSNVHSSNGRTEMSIGDSNVHSSNGRIDIVGCLNTSVSYPQGVMLDRITSLQQFWHCKSKMSIGQTEMSNGHSYVHSSIGRTEMSIGHPNVHSSIGRMDEWTLSYGNHSSLLSTWGQTQSDYVITASLHCKRYMSIGHK